MHRSIGKTVTLLQDMLSLTAIQPSYSGMWRIVVTYCLATPCPAASSSQTSRLMCESWEGRGAGLSSTLWAGAPGFGLWSGT